MCNLSTKEQVGPVGGTGPVTVVGACGRPTYLSACNWRNVDHVDVDYQIKALSVDPSPVLVGQRSIQVDGRHYIVQLVVSSVRFYTENGDKRRYC